MCCYRLLDWFLFRRGFKEPTSGFSHSAGFLQVIKDRVEYPVDERGRLPAGEALRNLDRLVDARHSRDVRAAQDLVGGDADQVSVHGAHAGHSPVLRHAGDGVVEGGQITRDTAHEALGCEGYTRTDQIISQGGCATTPGTPIFLEINTLPGLTRRSFIPQQLAAEGTKMIDFLEGQIVLAQRRARGWASS